MDEHSNKKRIKRRRRGEGNMMEKAEDPINDLQNQAAQAPLMVAPDTDSRDIDPEAEKVQIMSADVVETKTKPAAPNSAPNATPNAAANAAGVVCVMDMGEHSKKRIKRLRRGEGNLMEKVEDAISDLKTQGVLDQQVQTVVVVVREESGGLFN
jgi:Family of unknown function (DUF6200)